MATRRRPNLRRRSSGFGGGLGYSMIRSRQRTSGGGRGTVLEPTRRPPTLLPQAPQTPGAGDIDLSIGALSGGVGGYDLGADPAVAAAAGLAAKARALAQATALARRKQAAIEYGDPSGVEGIDEETAKAARENPFGILKNLERSYTTGREQLEEGLNAANLFYGGYRGKQLAEAARGYEQSRYGAGTAFRGLMSDVNTDLARALLEADFMEAQAAMGSSGGGGGGYYDEEDAGGGYDPYRFAGGNRQALLGGPPYGGPPSSTKPIPKRKPLRKRAAGFGGGLGYALLRS